MTDEKTTTPAAPDVDPGAPSAERPEEIQQLHKAVGRLQAENGRLVAANVALREELNEARGVHKPKPFPCAVYRDDATREAKDEPELTHLIAGGWSETPK